MTKATRTTSTTTPTPTTKKSPTTDLSTSPALEPNPLTHPDWSTMKASTSLALFSSMLTAAALPDRQSRPPRTYSPANHRPKSERRKPRSSSFESDFKRTPKERRMCEYAYRLGAAMHGRDPEVQAAAVRPNYVAMTADEAVIVGRAYNSGVKHGSDRPIYFVWAGEHFASVADFAFLGGKGFIDGAPIPLKYGRFA
jgi:hypothetical protein